MVVFSTVYLLACILSLVFFDWHAEIFSFMVFYGQGVVLVTCVWQYSWLDLPARDLDYIANLVGLHKIANVDEVWLYITPHIGILVLCVVSRICFVRRCQWNAHLDRHNIQSQKFKKETLEKDLLIGKRDLVEQDLAASHAEHHQALKRQRASGANLGPEAEVKEAAKEEAHLARQLHLNERLEAYSTQIDALEVQIQATHERKRAYQWQASSGRLAHPHDEAYQEYLGGFWESVLSRVGGYHSYESPVVCYVTFTYVAYQQPVVIIRMGYLAYLFFCLLAQVPDTIFYLYRAKNMISSSWVVPTMYSAANLIGIYCYQFEPASTYFDTKVWANWGNITVPELGFSVMDNRIVTSLENTAVVIFCIIQWRVFLTNADERALEEQLEAWEGGRTNLSSSFAQSILKRVRTMIDYHQDVKRTADTKMRVMDHMRFNFQCHKVGERFRSGPGLHFVVPQVVPKPAQLTTVPSPAGQGRR